MSRPPRKLSQTGLYHIIYRGINRQNIFEEQKDYEKLINIMADIKAEKSCEIYAYCLMTNHVHLFIKEKIAGDIMKIMHKLLTRYVGWYNFKYQRSGSLIGNRYKSEPVEDERYCFSLIRYIHQNPIQAGIADKFSQYPWSSYNEYVGNGIGLTDTEFLLSMLSHDRKSAVKEFILFHNQENTNDFSISERKRLTDEQAKCKIKMVINDKEISGLALLPRDERNEYISVLRNKYGLTIRQLERLTGISRGIISRVR
ncbi:MAG: transposase [Bacillota bacterium]|nr:transposase [Bacillota bacterium]